MGRGYLGIDESNNGVFPEIFVGVYSTIESMVNKSQNASKLGKRRSWQNIVQQAFEKDRFHYVVIPRSCGKILSHHGMACMAMTELICHASAQDGLLQRVYIDGTMMGLRQERLEQMISSKMRPPSFECRARADQFIPLVNHADMLAHFIRGCYDREGLPNAKRPKGGICLSTLSTHRISIDERVFAERYRNRNWFEYLKR